MDWKIKITQRVAQNLVDIFIYKDSFNDGKIMLWTSKENDTFQITEFDKYSHIIPSFSMPESLLPFLLKELREMNIKDPEESYLKGKLEATENHLKDVRKLLKLK